MSISVRQLELGLDDEATDMMCRIDRFLREHWDDAFTPDEIWRREFGEPVLYHGLWNDLPLDQQRFMQALRVLREHRVIIGGYVAQEPAGVYYAASEGSVEDVLGPRD